MNSPNENHHQQDTKQKPIGLGAWLENWKERARKRAIYTGIAVSAGLLLVITAISALVGFRVAYDDFIINALRMGLLFGIGLAVYWFVRRPLNRLDKDYSVDELEGHYPELEGELRTYLQESERKEANPILGLIAKNIEAKLNRSSPEKLISENRLNLLVASSASFVILLVVLLVASGSNLRFGAQHFLSGWFLQDRLPPQSIVVTPGDSRLKRGANLTISAETLGFDASEATIYAQFGSSLLGGGEWDAVPMREVDDGQYQFSFFGVHDQLNYYVESAGIRSETHAIEVVDVAGIQGIEVTYNYPEWTGLEDRVQQTGTRIQGIAGTEVSIKIRSDRPLIDGQLMVLGEMLELTPFVAIDPAQNSGENSDEILAASITENISTAQLTLSETGNYYIADLFDDELIRLTDDYNIAVMDDQAPQVSISLPGADRGASSIEEVPMRIQVEDDYRIETLSLNFSVNAGDWTEIALPAEDTRVEADYLLMLEDLLIGEAEEATNLIPGDLISYFVSASDHNQDVTSDIYFIDIQPFDKRYSQGEAGAGGGAGGAGGGGGEDEISQRQRDILVATWNLQKEEEQNDEADEKYLEDNAFMLSELQRTLAEQTQTTLDRLDARRLLTDPRAQAFAENMEIALEAMQPAAENLLEVDLDSSVPNQQTALQHLLRAEAQFRDIQITIDQEGQEGGAGGGGGGAERDLAEIYELEMDMSRNQYETRQSPSLQEPQEAIEDAFDQLEELSRRQEALAEQARQNNELSLSERWEQEQLTREAQELQEELEQLQQQQQQSGEQVSESQQAATEALQQNLEEIIENMQQASESQSEPQSGGQPGGQPGGQAGGQQQAAESARAASEQLQETLDQLNQARQDQFRESIGDIGERTEELQRQQEDAEQQLAEALNRAMEERRESGDYTSGLTLEQEQALADLKRDMAEEVAEISDQLDSLVDGYSEQLPASSSALRAASDILSDERVEGRLTEAAEAIEYGLAPQVSVREFVVSDALQRLREQAEFAAGTAEAEMTRDRPETGPTTAEQISRLREELERNLQPRDAQAGTQGQEQPGQAQGEGQGEGQAEGQAEGQGQGQQQAGQGNGQPGQQGQAAGTNGQAGGTQAGVIRGGSDINPIGGRTDLGADFDFAGSVAPQLDPNQIADQATATAGQILALSNELLRQGLSDEEIIQAQQLARQLAAETGDSDRIAESLRALISQLEKLELGLDAEALNRNNLELRSGAGTNSESDEDVADYFRNLSELPIR